MRGALAVAVFGALAGAILRTGPRHYVQALYYTHASAAAQDAFVNSTLAAMLAAEDEASVQADGCCPKP